MRTLSDNWIIETRGVSCTCAQQWLSNKILEAFNNLAQGETISDIKIKTTKGELVEPFCSWLEDAFEELSQDQWDKAWSKPGLDVAWKHSSPEFKALWEEAEKKHKNGQLWARSQDYPKSGGKSKDEVHMSILPKDAGAGVGREMEVDDEDVMELLDIDEDDVLLGVDEGDDNVCDEDVEDKDNSVDIEDIALLVHRISAAD